MRGRCHHDHHRDPAGRLRFYFHARLHRRLFAWFGFSIFMTVAFAAVVITLASHLSGAGWSKEQSRLQRFVGDRFSEVWLDPPRREALIGDLQRDLGIDVALTDAHGKSLTGSSAPCEHAWIKAPVQRSGAPLGTVALCGQHHLPFGGWRLLLPLFVLWIFLWGVSGKIARRIARPLSDLAHVARELGRGKLSARAPLRHHQPGEIGILTDAFNDMADRIEQQIADQRELLAGVSHELRTPLARIRVLIELLRDGAGADRLEEIEREIIEIDALVGELLASARLDFAALVPHAIDGEEIARRALVRAGVPVAVLSVAGEVRFEGDPTLIARALANLIDNARKYGGGLVCLRVERRGEAIAFEAEDAGSGFSEESARTAFRAFAPPVQGQPREQGSLGLGLALVRRIAEAHGGRAYAGNRPGGGARVGIEVALRPTPAANVQRATG